MKNWTILLAIWLCLPMTLLIGQTPDHPIPSEDIQIKLALKAAPADQAEGARVLGYNSAGELIVIREGSNNLVCLTDDPAKNNIHVACYFAELEPFMARGRELAAQGLSVEERRKIRGEEAASGKLKMPEKPASLFVFDADQTAADLRTGEVSEGRLRAVIHVPYLTGDESGLPTEPVGGGMPWLMDAGTHRAHIMITPVKK